MFETEIIYRYDGTFDGLLTCVFKTYERKENPVQILPRDDNSAHLFTSKYEVETETNLARRVMQGVVKKTSPEAGRSLFQAFLAEEAGMEMTILRYIQKAMKSPITIEHDTEDEDVLRLKTVNKKMTREVQRIEATIQFQHNMNKILFAQIEPEFNIIPLIGAYFQRRYSGQKWMIYDTKRRLGIYYNLKEVLEIDMLETDMTAKTDYTIPQKDLSKTPAYQLLWQQYFNSEPIKPFNERLQVQFKQVPQVYWKYLSEKQHKTTMKSKYVPENGGKSFQVLPLY